MTPANPGAKLSLAEGNGPSAACLVIPTLAVPGLQHGYSYAIPAGMQIVQGDLVLIDLHGALRKGIVLETGTLPPPGVELKPVLAVFPGGPLMTPRQLELARWLSYTYHCTLFAAIQLNFWDLKFFHAAHAWRITDAAGALQLLTGRGLPHPMDAEAVLQFQDKVLREADLEKFWQALGVYGAEPARLLPFLTERGCLLPEYRVRQVKAQAVEPLYRAAPEVDPAALTPKERALWERLLQYAPPWDWAALREALHPLGRAQWNGLVRKGVLEPITLPSQAGHGPQHVLTRHQQEALDAILPGLADDQPHVHLLQGITGSGKTEVYLRAAQAALPYGAVLFLVPEIALTHQMVQRVRDYFGEDQVGILHSAQTDRERRQVWEGVRAGELRLLIGPRSALFAPADRISLILLDEEHEGAYKQHSAPRYHARTTAQKLAGLHGAVLLLGSATPSLESYHAAQRGTIAYHALPERAGPAVLPSVRIVELPGAAIRGGKPVITPELRELISTTLAKGKQALLFLNQRGFARNLQCVTCRWVPRCPRCAIALTVHTRLRKLICHHCDFTCVLPPRCEQCRADDLASFGFGTQQVESLAQELWPLARIARLDRDTAAARGALERILDRFARGEIDLLVGTQMVAKGLDIPGLDAVGVLLADQSLTLPDFRAAERTFQLLTQVAGRAGRRADPGQVIIQARDIEHPVLTWAAEQDHAAFAFHELPQRAALYYPPFCRLIRVLVESVEFKDAQNVAQDIVQHCLRAVGSRLEAPPPERIAVLGPAPAPLERLRLKWRMHLLLKVPALSQGIALVQSWEQAARRRVPKGTRITVDPDPLDLL